MEALLEEAAQKNSDFVRAQALYNRLLVQFGRRQVNCAVHGPFFEHIVHVPTRNKTHLTPCGECLAAARKLKQERKAKVEAHAKLLALEKRLNEAALPLRFADSSFDDFIADLPEQKKALQIARAFIEEFSVHRNSGRSLIFAGTPGTGKTLLAAMMLRQVCVQGYWGRYTTCQGIVSAVRRTWGSQGQGNEWEVLDSLVMPSLLVIDELGVQTGTDNEKTILFDVIDRRYREKRPTIFVTNLDADGLHDFVGDRNWDRLTEIVRWIPFMWTSQRSKSRLKPQAISPAQS